MTTVGSYDLFEMLGKGRFCKGVYRAVSHQTKTEYAMKVLPKAHLKGNNQLKREVAIMKKLRHPHVVELQEVLESRQYLFLAMEYVSGGTIEKVLGKGNRIPPENAKRYMMQLFDGLLYCHSHNVCHRDLKPANLMLDSGDNIKIVDFGFANFEVDEKLFYTRCGTPYYVAPEVLDFKKGYAGKSADTWSCGVILFQMLAGTLPFRESNATQLYKLIRNADYVCPPWFSPDVCNLLEGVLNRDPESRTSIYEAANHPWFQGEMTPMARDEIFSPTEQDLKTAITNAGTTDSLMSKSDYPSSSTTGDIATPPSNHADADSYANSKPSKLALSGAGLDATADNLAESTDVTADARAAAGAASSSAAVQTVSYKGIELYIKRSKLFSSFQLTSKNATVTLEGAQLYVVVDNNVLKPFPLSIASRCTFGRRHEHILLKLSKAFEPRNYRFTFKDKSNAKELESIIASRVAPSAVVTSTPVSPIKHSPHSNNSVSSP